MSARHAMSFPERQPPVIFNRTYVVNQPTYTRSKPSNGAFWGGVLGGVFSGVCKYGLSSRNTQTMQTENPWSLLNQNAGNAPAAPKENSDVKTLEKHYGSKYTISQHNDQLIATPKDGSGVIIADNFNDMLAKLSKPEVSAKQQKEVEELAAAVAQNTDGKGGVDDKYDIKEIPGNKTYTVQNGNTWYGIASAKYDLSNLPAGVTVKDVAYALAAANSGAEGAEAMQLAKQGVYFKVGDVINLPDKLTVNGQEISLKSDYENADVLKQDYGFVKATNWAITVQQVGSKWALYKNGIQQGQAYDSKEAAEQAKNLMQSNNEQ